MDPDGEAIICENSMLFPKGAFILMITRMMSIIPPAAINVCPVILGNGNDREGWMLDQSLPRT